MTRTLRTLAACLFVLAIGLPVAMPSARADIFTYTDDQGVVHFTNIPPRRERGVHVVMRTRPARPDDAPRATGGTRDGSTERYTRYDPHIREAAALYRLPESFIRAVIRVESDYHLGAISRVGAQGLMQLMPGTAARMGVRDAFDPRQNILGGTRYLRILANDFRGDLILTIAAYNAGEGAVVRYRGVPPYAETQRYVQRVLGWYYHYVQVEQGRATLAPAGRAWAPPPTQ
ncbi:MAG: lytic transglycosylase domain-containing protein [Sandaracinaceae bacterium]|jgi:soluble lytic murein transglycosylase-like protein|nr:lytic transglycosylase domain-containing protein [Sandaracinaceae bacterium]